MESETVDPIDRPLPPILYRGVPLGRHFYMELGATNQECWQGIRSRNHGTLGHRIAYASSEAAYANDIWRCNLMPHSTSDEVRFITLKQ